MLIAILDWLETNQVVLALGYFLLAALCFQAAASSAQLIRRMSAEGRQIRLEHQRLESELQNRLRPAAEISSKPLPDAWNGFRKFVVEKKEIECPDVSSIWLRPHDRKPLPPFKPGQYLTFQLHIPGKPKPLIRCYSLSERPGVPDLYRVTIKKVPPPKAPAGLVPGLASTYFNEQLREGDILDVKAPSGHFFLAGESERPVVLLSGGVGITPMLSMLNALVEWRDGREIWFIHGARNGSEQIQKQHLLNLASSNPNVRLHLCYSRPQPEERLGTDYQHAGRVTIDLIKDLLPSCNYDFYLCGPGGMMESLVHDLEDWGVPSNQIFFEAFGPASVKRTKAEPVQAPVANGIQITFKRTDRVCAWAGSDATLLDLADREGIRLDAGCRAGNCGTCLVALHSGEIEHINEPGCPVEEGSCLVCIARPKTSLVLDA